VSQWPLLSLAEVASPEKGAVISGPFGSNIGKRFFVDAGVPVIRGNNLADPNARFTDDGFVYVSEEKASALRCWAVPDDLIFTAAGSLGQVGLIPRHGRYARYVISNKQLRIRLDRTKLLPLFAYYYFSAPDVRAYVAGQNKGSSVPLITLGVLRSLPIVQPPLVTQRKIAVILSAYDDLIENNNRRIKLLEEMAQRIYREWFVEFRYPGHEQVPLVESEVGLVPSGWACLPASEVLTINPAITIDKATTRAFIPMASLSEEGMHINPIEERSGAAGSRFVNGDTLFARITPCLENGKTAYVQCLPQGAVASGSTEFIVLRSRRLTPELTYLLARDDRFRSHAIKSMSGASGRQRVREECFDSFVLATPPNSLLDAFAVIVRPLFAQSLALFVATGNLRATRDLLLPRLVSGEIDVTDLNIAMPEAAA
jgi:type I restriction enzyme S subunit